MVLMAVIAGDLGRCTDQSTMTPTDGAERLVRSALKVRPDFHREVGDFIMQYSLVQPRQSAFLSIALGMALAFAAPALGGPLPNDNEQEILVKATLMTFNDANLTGNYSVLYDKASKVFRSQVTSEKLSEAFKVFRSNKINIESIVADEIDSSKAPKIDDNGILLLQGRFKDDEKKIRFDLKFVLEDGAWKILGLNVKYKEE
jgi:hypothetical protein